MNESEFNRWIQEQLGQCHYMRVENTIQRGTPDINVCMSGAEVWVEAKIVKCGLVFLRPEQYAWGIRRSRNGGNVYVLAYHESVDTIFLWKYPDIEVKASGKYVVIVSTHQNYGVRNKFNVKSSLFTSAITQSTISQHHMIQP